MTITSAGLPARPVLVLEREERMYHQMASELISDRPGRTTGASVTFELLADAFAEADATTTPMAAFLAGRCDPDEPEASARLDDLLGNVVGRRAVADLGSWSLAYVEAAMSLVLRGRRDAGEVALAALLWPEPVSSTSDWLAIYYLAQLGRPEGYPKLIEMLEDDRGFTRLMAARHLAGFVPYEGQVIGGKEVDVVAALAARLDDEDSLVADEIPELLAEIGGRRALELVATAARDGRHASTRQAASAVLQHLDAG